MSEKTFDLLHRVRSFFVTTWDSGAIPFAESDNQSKVVSRTILPGLISGAREIRLYAAKEAISSLPSFAPPLIKQRGYFKLDISQECVNGFEAFWGAGAKHGKCLRGTVLIIQNNAILSPELFQKCYWGGILSSQSQLLNRGSKAALTAALSESSQGTRSFLLSETNGNEFIDIIPPLASLKEEYRLVKAHTQRTLLYQSRVIKSSEPKRTDKTGISEADLDKLLKMKSFFLLDGEMLGIGRISISFSSVGVTRKSGAQVSIVSESGNDEYGGVALNCLMLKGVEKVKNLEKKVYKFSNQDDSNTELSESVFWKPGNETVELEQLEIAFGMIRGKEIQIQICAICLDLNSRFLVAIKGAAEII